jgi:multiple sugar transport system permease protein
MQFGLDLSSTCCEAECFGAAPKESNGMTKKNSFKQSLTAKKDYLYVLPAAILISVFFISSIIFTIQLSFYSWDGFSDKIYVGVVNYSKLFLDANFRISAMNTLIWVVLSLVISLILPLLLAMLIVNSSRASFFKNIFYFPSTLSGTVGGLIMVAMLSKYGIPQLFGLMGFDSMVRDWLSVPYINTFVMIFMGTWQGIGMNMLLFIAGLRNLDRSPIESAQIDGAGKVLLYRKVVFPALKPTTIIVLLMSLVNSFKVFDSIWVMTKGGPYRSSETLALTMYTETFVRGDYGRGAAVAVILTIVIMVISYFNLKNTFRSNAD